MSQQAESVTPLVVVTNLAEPQRVALERRLGPDVVVGGVSDATSSYAPAEVLFVAPTLDALSAPWPPEGVRWVQLGSSGIDPYPPGLLAGRVVTGAQGVLQEPLAEWVITALLTEAKGNLWVREPATTWPPATPGLLGEHTVGIVGLGAIGVAVAERLVPFGCKVLGVRRSRVAAAIPGVEIVPDLETLLGSVDDLVLAAPLTNETRHLIDAAALDLVRPGIHLVNVARGQLIDTDALRPALDDGRVRAATLDVTDPEPLPAGHWLYEHPRVRISPHIGYWREDMFDRLLDRFVTNVGRFRRNEPLLGLVDVDRGY